MTRPDIEGVRLALLDGEGSLRPADASAPGEPNRHADLAIESIEIRQAKYIGRARDGAAPRPLTLELNPWLNTIIGGRGTGKSTIIDLCRITLRREKELGTDDSELASAFLERMRVAAGRDSEGLLTAATLVEVIYRKDGERFRLSWDQARHSEPIARFESTGVVFEAGDICDRFPARIYSVVARLREMAGDPQQRGPAEDRRFETAVRKVPPERLDRVALLQPGDAVRVSFKDPSTRDWQRIEQGRDVNYQSDAREIGGPLDEQVREALHFVRSNMQVRASKGMARAEQPPFARVADGLDLGVR
jgi:hypothetical protein